MNKTSLICLIAALLSVRAVEAQVIDCREQEPLTIQDRTQLAKAFRSWKHGHGHSRAELEDYTIPVVFHVFNSSSPSVSSVESLMSAVNDAFANAGAFETEGGANTRMRFCLANQAPDGGATSGVNYIESDYRISDWDLDHSDLVRHIKWDLNRYVNVWLVDQIPGEALADYEGRTWWTRLGVGGYAAGDGVVITSLSTETLAHEFGHYFGLLHTWQGRDCRNDDCLVDGDMVCDTPPDRSVFNSCNDNSCSTDTLSNFSNNTFFADTLDMGTNFMDYGNDGCSLDFSLGQAERMQFTLESNFPTLPLETRSDASCSSPCSESLTAQLTMSAMYPIAGQSISFSSNVTGTATNYEWYITNLQGTWTTAPSGTPVSTSANFDTTLGAEGFYSVYLRAWNAADSTCFTSVSRNFRVGCGVNAKFSPDKRITASKQPHALFTDSVTFVNYSFGATNYEWTIGHTSLDADGTTIPDSVFTDENLTYYFREPGSYDITLVASAGACEHTSHTYNLQVDDPTMDGAPVILDISCDDPERIYVQFALSNNGYDTIRGNTPIAFYDGNPLQNSGANLIGKVELPGIVYGFDSETFSVELEHDLATLAEVFIVFNDTGRVDLPLDFPPGDQNRLSTETIFPITGFSELTYDNNVAGFTVDNSTEFSGQVVVCEGQPLEVALDDIVISNICWDSVFWDSNNLIELISGNIVIPPEDITDPLDLTLVSSSGVRVTGSIDVITSAPEYLVDTVYRIVRGQQVQITIAASGDYRYEWSPQETLSDPFSNSTLAAPEENILYIVRITDEFGCAEQQAIRVWVETTAYLPSLFTPNNDGSNDQLRAYDLLQVAEIQFRVVSKEGVVVFQSSSAFELARSGWDGDKNGQPQPSGTYFWSVEGTYEDGRRVLFNGEQSGVVHLIR